MPPRPKSKSGQRTIAPTSVSTSTPVNFTIPLPTTPAELESVLSLLLTPDTAQLAHATETLNAFINQSHSVPALFQQLTTNQNAQIRQIAAVLLRKHINKLWPTIDSRTQESIRTTLLQHLYSEPNRLVRLSVAALIATLAKKTKRKASWPALLTIIFESIQSPQSPSESKEISFLLLAALFETENIAVSLFEHLPLLQRCISAAVNSEDERVVIASLRALESLAYSVPPDSDRDIMTFSVSVPALINRVQTYSNKPQHNSNEEEAVFIVFDILDMLACSPVSIFDKHIAALTHMMITTVTNTRFDINTRNKASLFLVSLIEAKPIKLVKAHAVPPLLQACFMLLCEDKVLTDTDSADDIGFDLFDAVMLNLPRKHTFTMAITAASTFLQPSNPPAEKKCGLLILAIMSEPCNELLLSQLDSLIVVICNSTRESSPIVRSAAWMALQQFITHFDQLVAAHQMILPYIFDCLANENELSTIKSRACTVLELFASALQPADIKPYMQLMMTALTSLLQKGNSEIQRSAVSAIKDVAIAAGKDFMPYFPVVIELLSHLITITNDELLPLRCAATECVGYVAVAVEKEVFAPYLTPFIAEVMKGMTFDYISLRQSAYIFFTRICEMLQAEFQPYVSSVVILILATLGSKDGMYFHKKSFAASLEGRDENEELFEQKENDDDSDRIQHEEEDDDGDEDREKAKVVGVNLSIRTGAIDEKVAAYGCLAGMFEYLDVSFVPYITRCLLQLAEDTEYPHEDIRLAVVNCYICLIGFYHRNFPLLTPLVKGQAVQLRLEHAEILSKVIEVLLFISLDDDSKNVISEALGAIQFAIKLFGLSAIQPFIAKLNEVVLLLVKEKHSCQRPTDDTEDETEVLDHPDLVLNSLTDLIPVWAEFAGSSFTPYLKTMFPNLIKFTAAHRSNDDRAIVIGSLAEIVVHLGNDMQPYLQRLYPLTLSGLKDPNVAIRRNSAFLAGALAKGMPSSFDMGKIGSEMVSALLRLCEPINQQFTGGTKEEKEEKKMKNGKKNGVRNLEDEIIVSKDEFLACKDNAVSAVFKIIAVAPTTTSLPLNQILPYLLSHLPLTEDYQEAYHVYPILISFYRTIPHIIGPFTPAVIRIFCEVMGEEEVDPVIRDEIRSFCNALNGGSNGESVRKVVEGLTSDQKESWKKFVV